MSHEIPPSENCLDASVVGASCVWALWSFVIRGVFNAGCKTCSQGFTPNDFDWSQGIGPHKQLPLLVAIALFEVDKDLQTRLETIKWILRRGADPKQTHPEDFSLSFTLCRDVHPESTALFRIAYRGHSAISFTFALLDALHKQTETDTALLREVEEVFGRCGGGIGLYRTTEGADGSCTPEHNELVGIHEAHDLHT